jgi:hypothetical protein
MSFFIILVIIFLTYRYKIKIMTQIEKLKKYIYYIDIFSSGLGYSLIAILIILTPILVLFISMILTSDDIIEVIKYIVKEKWNLTIRLSSDNFNVNNIFTGLIAFIGVILSFSGIYIKTNYEERKKKINEEKIMYNLFKYAYEDNLSIYPNEKSNSINLGIVYKKIIEIIFDTDDSENVFCIIEEDIIKEKMDSILNLKIGRQLINSNKNMIKINGLVREISNQKLFKKIEDKVKLFYKNDEFGEIIEREIDIIKWLKLENISEIKESILLKTKDNYKEICLKFNESSHINKLYKSFIENFTKPIDNSNNTLCNYCNRLYFIELILREIMGLQSINESNYKKILESKKATEIILISELVDIILEEGILIQKIILEMCGIDKVLKENYEICKIKQIM